MANILDSFSFHFELCNFKRYWYVISTRGECPQNNMCQATRQAHHAKVWWAWRVLTQGFLTEKLIRNIETNAWYKNVNYFDYKSRIIQGFSQNHLGGIDRSEYQYRFNNEVLAMRLTHQKNGRK